MEKLQTPIWVSIGIPLRLAKGGKNLELWMQSRREDGELDGKLEFPGGKIEQGEMPVDALVREIKEETEVEVQEPVPFKIYKHSYSDRSVVLNVFLTTDRGFDPKGWCSYDLESTPDWDSQNIPAANKQILSDLWGYVTRNRNHLQKVLPWIQ